MESHKISTLSIDVELVLSALLDSILFYLILLQAIILFFHSIFYKTVKPDPLTDFLTY